MNTTSKSSLLLCACLAALFASGTVLAQDKKMMKRGDMAMHMMSADSTIAG